MGGYSRTPVCVARDGKRRTSSRRAKTRAHPCGRGRGREAEAHHQAASCQTAVYRRLQATPAGILSEKRGTRHRGKGQTESLNPFLRIQRDLIMPPKRSEKERKREGKTDTGSGEARKTERERERLKRKGNIKERRFQGINERVAQCYRP